MVKKDTIFLLRAFGDFVIAMNVAKGSKRSSEIGFIASKHLEPLYNAFPSDLRPAFNIRFVDFGIRKNIFRCFTDRYFLTGDTFKELLALASFVKNNRKDGNLYLEQKKRRFFPSLFSGYHFKYILNKGNVYDVYSTFFQSSPQNQSFPFDAPSRHCKILVIRDARVQARNITPEIIDKINRSYQPLEATIVTAFFGYAPDGVTGSVAVYRNFEELIALIRTADLVIGSDSMPVHLCQFLKKPHYTIHYAEVQHFLTPFVLQHHCHFSFEELATRNTFLPNP